MDIENAAGIEAGYVGALLDPKTYMVVFDRLIQACAVFDSVRPFQTIVFTGASGSMIGPALAAMSGKKMVLVRKCKTEVSTHSYRNAEGAKDAGEYLIVDDLVGTGTSVDRIIDRMNRHDRDSSCVGVVQYAAGRGGKHCRAGLPLLPGKRAVLPLFRPKATR